MRDVDIALPTSSRAAWIFLIAVGVLCFLLGALLLLADLEAFMAGASLIGAFILLGTGLFLSCFGVLVGFNRERVSSLRVNPAAITVEDGSGDRVDIPWTEVERVQGYPAQGDNQGWVVTLNKRDGGLLELLGTKRREDADRIVSEMEEARSNAPDSAATSGEPESHLSHIAGVTATRLGDGLELLWDASVPFRRMLFFGPVLGMALIVFGFHREQGGVGTAIAMAFMGLIGGLLLASTVRLVGIRQRIHVDGRQLTIEKRRGDKTVEQRSVPTFSVVTVDYTHQLTVIGAHLNLRTAQGQDNKDSAMDELQGMENPNPVQMAKAFASLMKQGVQIPMGGLSLPAKIAVDLALSAEVARRTGKSSAAV